MRNLVYTIMIQAIESHTKHIVVKQTSKPLHLYYILFQIQILRICMQSDNRFVSFSLYRMVTTSVEYILPMQ